jgi:hypothetical protein
MTEWINELWFWGLCATGLVFVLLAFKTSRPDGKVEKVHPYRRMVPIIMRRRNESVVYFDMDIPAERLEAYIARAKEAFGANMTHAIVASVNAGIFHTPSLNRFIAGRRVYRRNGRWITFSMKRQKKNRQAKLGVVKLEMNDTETFPELVERINGKINHERSGKKTDMDKELALFGLVPTLALRGAFKLFLALDYVGLLPHWFMKGDGMFTSAFIANLGSIGMKPGFHHLYEWGNAPIFMTVGAVEERVVVKNGAMTAARILPARFAYDERIDDGMTAQSGMNTVRAILTDPERWLGGLEGQAPPMCQHDGPDPAHADNPAPADS